VTAWRAAIEEEWRRRHPERQRDAIFPLTNMGFDSREIVAAVDVLLSGQITMGQLVRSFEVAFAEKIGVPYAVMVNSGSSANLLAFAALCNPQRPDRLQPGDEVLVPAVCWSTSFWPIVQHGLRPVFVDVDPRTLNIDLDDLRNRITPRSRALIAVHVLGNAAPMAELLAIVQEHGLALVEDTCESLGSRADGRTLGSHGSFGTFSFYYSHHITTGEGGMVVCRTEEDFDLLKCLRAHGWSRDLSNRQELETTFDDIDPRFLFVNAGYCLRPLEFQAAFGLSQLERLDSMNAARSENHAAVIDALRRNPRWADQYQWAVAPPGVEPAWFGLPLLMAGEWNIPKLEWLGELSRRGVENRPIISGNFARQPGVRAFGIDVDPSVYVGADVVHERGFFIGLHSSRLDPELVDRLADALLP
jgi:CDP-6-deoxy-D-xylo-4-hexulose-3-dehydrase